MVENNNTINKRVAPRYPILVTRAKVEGDDKRYFFGYAGDISRAGMFIASVNPKPVGEEFNIEFTIPRTDITVRCVCRVVWNRKYSASAKLQPGMGIMFIDLPPETADMIDTWVSSKLEEGGI